MSKIRPCKHQPLAPQSCHLCHLALTNPKYAAWANDLPANVTPVAPKANVAVIKERLACRYLGDKIAGQPCGSPLRQCTFDNTICATLKPCTEAKRCCQTCPHFAKHGPLPAHNTFTIPKVFHRIWVGSKLIPERFERYWETWQQHHPDAQFRTWTDADIPSFGPEIVRLCGQCRNPAEVSDVLRFCIIAEHGGIYLDTDFECVKPIWELLHGWDFATCWENPTVASSAFFASVPGHPILQRMMGRLRTLEIDPTVTQMKTAGPLAFGDAIGDKFQPGIVIYPTEYFYGIKYDDRNKQAPTPANAYGIHWWSHTWEDWWVTLTIRVLDPIDALMIDRSQLGAGDVVQVMHEGTKQPITTTHVCDLLWGCQFTADGIKRIRQTLRHAPNYAENCFGFPDDQGGVFWVRSSKQRSNAPVYVHGSPVVAVG